jgi:surface antigen
MTVKYLRRTRFILFALSMAITLVLLTGFVGTAHAATSQVLRSQKSLIAAHTADDQCQCTTYAANFYGLPGKYPDAKDWPGWLSGLGSMQDSEPSVGDIIVFQPSVDGADGTYGHVGIVEDVTDDGNGQWTITMDSANWDGGTSPSLSNAGCTNVTETSITINDGDNVSFYQSDSIMPEQ